ncbi:DUF2361 domain containing protein [Rhypophila decipiens]
MPKRKSRHEVENGKINPDRAQAMGIKRKPKRQKVTDGNMGWIKKRARAIERLFEHDNAKMPAHVRGDLERELAAHKQRIAEDRQRKHRSKMIGKYHMVRFFERKKATRRAKQIKKQLAETTDPEEKARLESDLHVAEVDIDYAIYYPFLERYISLYAAPGKEEKGEGKEKKSPIDDLHTPRPPIWSVIEKAREEGKAALEKIQNRQSEADEEVKKGNKGGIEKQKRLPSGKKTSGGGDDEDEIKNEGFFEE